MKVLIIDDQPEVLKQIENAIAEQQGVDGKPYDVTGLTDHHKALQLLDRKHFDVVVTDMVMGSDHDEGLAVLQELAERSPITIVLTAYGSNDNCVAAMRAGAWDYIEKMPLDYDGDPYERLLQSIRDACQYRLDNPGQFRSRRDGEWAHEHMDELMESYPGEVVAVLDGKVVAHHRTYSEVAEAVKQQYPVAEPMVVVIPDTRVETVG